MLILRHINADCKVLLHLRDNFGSKLQRKELASAPARDMCSYEKDRSVAVYETHVLLRSVVYFISWHASGEALVHSMHHCASGLRVSTGWK